MQVEHTVDTIKLRCRAMLVSSVMTSATAYCLMMLDLWPHPSIGKLVSGLDSSAH